MNSSGVKGSVYRPCTRVQRGCFDSVAEKAATSLSMTRAFTQSDFHTSLLLRFSKVRYN